MDEIQRLILQVQGQQEAERLRAELQAQEQTLRELNEMLRVNGTLSAAQAAQQERTAKAMAINQTAIDNMKRGTWTTTTAIYEFADSYEVLGKAEAEAKSQIEQVTEGMRRSGVAAKNAKEADEARLSTMRTMINGWGDISVATDKAGKSSSAFGYTVLQTGRIIQDFSQGGIGGILNNLEGLAVAMGLGPGVAGAATALGVAFYLLGPKISVAMEPLKELFKIVDYGKDEITKLTERIKELEEKPHKLVIDLREIENARKRITEINDGLRAFDEWSKSHTDYEQKSGQAVSRFLREAPGGANASANAVRATMRADIEASDGPLREARARVRNLQKEINRIGPNGIGVESLKEALKEAMEQAAKATINVSKQAESQAGNLYQKAGEGDRVAQGMLAKLLRRTGQRTLAQQIEGVSPERLKAEELREEQDTAKAEAAQESDKLRRAMEENPAAAEQWKKMTAAEKAAHYRKANASGTGASDTAAFAAFVASTEQVNQLGEESTVNARAFTGDRAQLVKEFGQEPYNKYLALPPEARAALARPGEGHIEAARRWMQEQNALGEESAAGERAYTEGLRRKAAVALPRLGPDFGTMAGEAQIRINRMPEGKSRRKAQERLNRQIQQAAGPMLLASGVAPTEVGPIASQMPHAVQESVRQGQAAAPMLGLPPGSPDVAGRLEAVRAQFGGALEESQRQVQEMLNLLEWMGQTQVRVAKMNGQIGANAQALQRGIQGQMGGVFGNPAGNSPR